MTPIREAVYTYMQLPYHQQIQIAQQLGVWTDELSSYPTQQEKDAEIFKRIGDSNKIELLRELLGLKKLSPESAAPVAGKEKEELRKTFFKKFTYTLFDGEVCILPGMINEANILFDFFWSEIEDLKILLEAAKRGCDVRDEELSRLRSLVKAADSVIELGKKVINSVDGHDWEIDFNASEEHTAALENYQSLKFDISTLKK